MKKNLRKKLLAVALMATMVFSTSGFAFANETDVEKSSAAEIATVPTQPLDNSQNVQASEGSDAADQATEKLSEAIPDDVSSTQAIKSRTLAEGSEYAAQIGNIKYETLQEAIDTAKDGDTITVLADIYDEQLYMDPGRNVSLTIDFYEHSISTDDCVDMFIIYSGNIKILNAIIVNLNFDVPSGENASAVYISNADVTLENCYASTASSNSFGYYITGNSAVTMNNCGFIDIAGINDETGELSQTGVVGCLVDDNSVLTTNGCYIAITDGDGVYSYGTTNINGSYIYVDSKNSQAIIALEGGIVNINDGYYYGNPALFIYDADSSATITKGEFVSSREGYSAIDDDSSGDNFGANVTIASGSMCSPSESNWKANGAESIDVYKQLAAPTSAAAKLSKYNAVTFSWSKVSGASAYKVYYKKSSAKSYSLLKTTTSTSVTKTGLSAGVKYDFRVYPCDTLDNGGDAKYCQSSNYKAASVYTLKKLSTPKVTKKSKSSVTVKWTNISGEAGYQISKSTKKTGTSIVATYKTTTGKSKVIKAKKGKTYYYKVRAYALDSKGNKVYGPWSSVKSYKIK